MVMKTAGVKDFKTHLSEYLRDVQRGETVLVTDRGRVVAEVRPPGASTVAVTPAERRLLEAAERGLIRLPTAKEGEPLWANLPSVRLPRGEAQRLLDESREERE